MAKLRASSFYGFFKILRFLNYFFVSLNFPVISLLRNKEIYAMGKSVYSYGEDVMVKTNIESRTNPIKGERKKETAAKSESKFFPRRSNEWIENGVVKFYFWKFEGICGKWSP